MNKTRTNFLDGIEQLLPWGVFVILLLFTYGKFFQYPYIGFRWNAAGQVAFIFVKAQPGADLQIGDQLLQAGSVRWAEYKGDSRKAFIDHVHAGQVLQLSIERNGQPLTIPWVIPGPTAAEISDRLWTEGWVAFAFWFMGTLTFVNLRPKNERWRLLVAFNFLTAIWLTVGSGLSLLHIWETAILLRVFVWLCVPVYLHLHWVFPKPLGRLSPGIVRGAYLLAAALAVAQLFQLIPQSYYYLGFLFSILGSLILLLAHAIRQVETRRELRTLILVAFVSFAPSLVISLLGRFIDLPAGLGGLGLLSLPLLPLAYFYAVLRRQLGGLELRFNQTLSVYIYTTLLLVALLPSIVLIDLWGSGVTGSALVMGIAVLIITALVTIFGYGYIQAFIERSILGVSLPPRDLLELYSERITTSTSFDGLQKILEAEILPRLRIKQFVFFQIDKGASRLLHSTGIQTKDLPDPNALVHFCQLAGKYLPAESAEAGQPFGWVRLAIELKIESELVGVWLFGRYDPDDFYSQVEINLIQSLANQTAIAMSNILQTQLVLEMYQQDIGRHENDRMRLALELHDSILNQMAAFFLSLDDKSISERSQEAYDELIERLRGIVNDLRPPMLNYGLKPAIEELADGLLDRYGNLNIVTGIDANENRYDPQVEQHIFRIAQEACENAIRHGHAAQINISGYLRPREIFLKIEDNGIGFDGEQGNEFAHLLANKHFGLAGMIERARLINGEVKIHSAPAAGTSIEVAWKASGAV